MYDMVNNVNIGKSPNRGQPVRAFLTPYLMNLIAMVIANISHSDFSVIQKNIFHHPFLPFSLNWSVTEEVSRSLPLNLFYHNIYTFKTS